MQESLQLSSISHDCFVQYPSRCFLITPNLSENRILNHLLLTLETLPQLPHPSSMEALHSMEVFPPSRNPTTALSGLAATSLMWLLSTVSVASPI